MTVYHVPAKEFSPIDALNRRAAALGSPRYAGLTAHADYNGHHVRLTWNEYRGYYITEYTWNGRQVLARGEFADCLDAAMAELNRAKIGSSMTVEPRADDAEAHALCVARGLEVDDGKTFAHHSSWWTWRHTAASESVRDYANWRMLCLLFDWELMQAANSREEYEAALKAKHGRIYC